MPARYSDFKLSRFKFSNQKVPVSLELSTLFRQQIMGARSHYNRNLVLVLWPADSKVWVAETFFSSGMDYKADIAKKREINARIS